MRGVEAFLLDGAPGASGPLWQGGSYALGELDGRQYWTMLPRAEAVALLLRASDADWLSISTVNTCLGRTLPLTTVSSSDPDHLSITRAAVPVSGRVSPWEVLVPGLAPLRGEAWDEHLRTFARACSAARGFRDDVAPRRMRRG